MTPPFEAQIVIEDPSSQGALARDEASIEICLKEDSCVRLLVRGEQPQSGNLFGPYADLGLAKAIDRVVD
jgi:hypothetical protein